MTQWIDEKKKQGPFEGCLIVLNIGDENAGSLPPEYLEQVQEATRCAHAGGELVLWAYYRNTGAMPQPSEFDSIEGTDFTRMMFDTCGRGDANFNLLPSERNREFRAVADAVFSNGDFSFVSRRAKIIGKCEIDGAEVLMPLTDIP